MTWFEFLAALTNLAGSIDGGTRIGVYDDAEWVVACARKLNLIKGSDS